MIIEVVINSPHIIKKWYPKSLFHAEKVAGTTNKLVLIITSWPYLRASHAFCRNKTLMTSDLTQPFASLS